MYNSENNEKARPLVERVLHYRVRKEDEKPLFSEIFCTTSGILFGNQADEVMEFGLRGQFITMIPQLIEFVKKAGTIVGSDEYEHLVLKDKTAEMDPKFITMRSAIKEIDLEELNGFEEVLTKTDRLWYISLIVFALYSYLDLYSRSLSELISTNEHLRSMMELHLKRSIHNESGEEQILVDKTLKGFGMSRRLKEIETGLEMDSILIPLIGEPTLTSYRGAFSKFKKLRNKIAHNNPRLGVSEYTYEAFETDLDEIKLDFEQVEMQPEIKALFGDTLQLLQQPMMELQEYIKRTSLIVGMATLYPALIDAVLSVLIA